MALTREQYLYMAKLAEQAERYEEMVQYMDSLVGAAAGSELNVEERNLLSIAYKNVIGSLRAAWRIVSSIEQKEEGRKNDDHIPLVKDYRSKVETELSQVCGGILKLLGDYLIPAAASSESKVFYLKMKGDYYRYLAEFKSGNERKEAAEDTMLAYKAAQEIAVADLAGGGPSTATVNTPQPPQNPPQPPPPQNPPQLMPPQNPPVRGPPQNPPVRAPPQNQPRSTREDGTFTTRVHHSGKMVNTIGKEYMGGKVEHIHKCDPDKWSKLEVDDALEKVGVDVRGLDYYFLKPGMNMDEGLVRFFDNNSSMEIAVLGVDRGVVELYAVEANEVLHSQTPPPREDGSFTTRLIHSGMMLDSGGKCYIGGQEQYIDTCDPDRWSKLEVDDVLEKLGVDVSRLHYYYLKPGDERLVRLFDNISSMEMAELGVQRGIVDVYAVHENDVLVSQLTQELRLSDVGTGTAEAVSVGSVDVGAANVGSDDFDIWIRDGAGGDRRGGDVAGDTLIISDVEDDVLAEQEKTRAMRKAKGKAKAARKSTSKVLSSKIMKIAAQGIRMRSARLQATDKGKAKLSEIFEKMKKNVKGKNKLSETSEKAKNNDKAKAIKKGKNKVAGDSSRVAHEDPVEDDPSFVDSDYDLSEHEEDSIMAAQVEGWKKVVDEMSTHPIEHIGDTSDSDQLPSDSPSSGTEDELDYDNEKCLTRRYKKATDFNDPLIRPISCIGYGGKFSDIQGLTHVLSQDV